MTEYTPWRERYAPPVIRMRNPFVAATEQVTRYARQLSYIEWNLRLEAKSVDVEIMMRSGYMAVWDAYQNFIAQFEGNVREVLTRTFWQAYHS